MTGMPRLGLLGGTFDPIHLGHLDVAEAARDALGLDRVLLVPARVPPHRSLQPRASGYHRFAMVALAVAAHPLLEACDLELRAEGRSYTALTLERLHARGLHPLQLFFITGADAFAEIATWHRYPALLDMCHFIVVSRPGHSHDAICDRLPDLGDRFVAIGRECSGRVATRAADPSRTAIFLVEADTSDVSSTEVRRRLEAGEPLDGLLPSPVIRHIHQHRLYRPGPPPADHLHDED